MSAKLRILWRATAVAVLLAGCAPAVTPPQGPQADPRFRDYYARVTEKIRANQRYPCIEDRATQTCEHRAAKVVVAVEFLENGVVQSVEVRQRAGPGLELYDDSAVAAIRRASPLPAMPREVAAALKQGNSSAPAVFRFNYVVEFGK